MHISHGLFWRDADGQPPPPFTVITHAEARAGKWAPVDPAHRVNHLMHLWRTGCMNRLDSM